MSPPSSSHERIAHKVTRRTGTCALASTGRRRNLERAHGVRTLVQRSLLALLLAAVTLLLAYASVAEAAAPRIVIISGKPLRHQVVISDWGRIAVLTWVSPPVRPIPRAQLAHRPRMKISMFWGLQWNEYLSTGKPATALRPRQADQVGSFYPAWRGRPAVIDLPWAGQWPRPLSAKAVSVLRRYDVPTRLPKPPHGSRRGVRASHA